MLTLFLLFPILLVVAVLSLFIRLLTLPFRFGRGWGHRGFRHHHHHRGFGGGGLMTILLLVGLDRLFGRRF